MDIGVFVWQGGPSDYRNNDRVSWISENGKQITFIATIGRRVKHVRFYIYHDDKPINSGFLSISFVNSNFVTFIFITKRRITSNFTNNVCNIIASFCLSIHIVDQCSCWTTHISSLFSIQISQPGWWRHSAWKGTPESPDYWKLQSISPPAPPRNKKEILSSLSKESREGKRVAFDFPEERLALPGKWTVGGKQPQVRTKKRKEGRKRRGGDSTRILGARARQFCGWRTPSQLAVSTEWRAAHSCYGPESHAATPQGLSHLLLSAVLSLGINWARPVRLQRKNPSSTEMVYIRETEWISARGVSPPIPFFLSPPNRALSFTTAFLIFFLPPVRTSRSNLLLRDPAD